MRIAVTAAKTSGKGPSNQWRSTNRGRKKHLLSLLPAAAGGVYERERERERPNTRAISPPLLLSPPPLCCPEGGAEVMYRPLVIARLSRTDGPRERERESEGVQL